MMTPSVRFDFLFCPPLLGTPDNVGVVDLNEVQVELFTSKEQLMMQLYCSRYLNNAYRFYCRSMGLCYANSPFSQLAKVLTKIALKGASVVLCTLVCNFLELGQFGSPNSKGMPCTQCAHSAKFWMSANTRTLVLAPFHKFLVPYQGFFGFPSI